MFINYNIGFTQKKILCLFVLLFCVSLGYPVISTQMNTHGVNGDSYVDQPILFVADYEKVGGYGVQGISNNIGDIIWQSSDLDSNNGTYSIELIDSDLDGTEDAVAIATYTQIYAYYLNGTFLWNYSGKIASESYSMLVADMDGNGINERLVVSSYSNSQPIFILNVSNGNLITNLTTGSTITTAITMGNFGSGINDSVVKVGYFNNAYLYNSSDLFSWNKFDMGSSTSYEVYTYDINSDGYDEIFRVGGSSTSKLRVTWGNNLSVYYTKSLGNSDFGSMDFIDIDGDSVDEIVATAWQNIHYYELNGTYINSFIPGLNPQNLYSFDWDGNGVDELVIRDKSYGSSNGMIQLLNLTSVIFQDSILSNEKINSIKIGNFTNNSYDKIIASTSLGNIYLWDRSLNKLDSWNLGFSPFGSNHGDSESAEVFDINNDSIDDYLVVSNDGFLYVVQQSDCIISFNDSTTYNMSFDIFDGRWELEKTFASNSSYYYNISCSKGGYQSQSVSNQIFSVSNQTYNLLNALPNSSSTIFPSTNIFSLILIFFTIVILLN
jgi:hypothetical protein